MISVRDFLQFIQVNAGIVPYNRILRPLYSI
jgi:hypothetical protein